MDSYNNYLLEIKKCVNKMGHDRFMKMKIKMLDSLNKCLFETSKIPEEYKMHEPGEFFYKRCHEKAIKYIFDLHEAGCNVEKVMLIQGRVWPYSKLCKSFAGEAFWEEHSWVEIENRIVFDPVLQNFYSIQCYDKYKVKDKIYKLDYKKVVELVNKHGKVCFFPNK